MSSDNVVQFPGNGTPTGEAPEAPQPVKVLHVYTCGVCNGVEWIIVLENGAFMCKNCNVTLMNCHAVEGPPAPIEGYDPFDEVKPSPDV